MNKKHLIAGIVVVLAVVLALYSFKTSLTPYVTIDEAVKGKRSVQVAGILLKGSDRYDFKKNTLFFTLKEDSGNEMKVEYMGSIPSNFDDVFKVVVTGKYDTEKKIFIAKQLLAKCPTKYEGRVKGNE